MVDILIENLPRLNSKVINGQKNFQLNDGVKSLVGSNFSSLPNGSIFSAQSTSTVTNQNTSNSLDRANTSLSQFTNESILDSELSTKQRKTPAEVVLGAIAGLNSK